MQTSKTTDDPEEYRKGREYALMYLGRMESSARNLHRKIVQKGISEETATLIVDEMIQKSWVSDERYSNMFIRQQLNRSKGPRFIRQKLKEHGIDLSCQQVSTIASEVSQVSEIDAARTYIAKKFPEYAEDKKTAARATQALVRRGFSYDTIREVMRIRAE